MEARYPSTRKCAVMNQKHRPTPRQVAEQIANDSNPISVSDWGRIVEAALVAIKEERRIIQRLTLALKKKRGAV